VKVCQRLAPQQMIPQLAAAHLCGGSAGVVITETTTH
jgi:hypothetical protein